MKPNLLCVGNVKAGSTSLNETLNQHSQIFMAKEKEIHFFDFNYDKGFDWYESHFKQHTNELIVGETTPNYMYRDIFLDRIYNYADDLKIIVLIRNPIERALSHHNMFYLGGVDKYTTITESNMFNWYMEKSLCYDRIKQLEDRYDVLCVQTEKLDQSYNMIQKWLGVDNENLIPVRAMVAPSKLDIDIETKKTLLPFFKDEIENLEEHLGWDLKNYKTVT